MFVLSRTNVGSIRGGEKCCCVNHQAEEGGCTCLREKMRKAQMAVNHNTESIFVDALSFRA
jgi:hypothetical protein